MTTSVGDRVRSRVAGHIGCSFPQTCWNCAIARVEQGTEKQRGHHDVNNRSMADPGTGNPGQGKNVEQTGAQMHKQKHSQAKKSRRDGECGADEVRSLFSRLDSISKRFTEAERQSYEQNCKQANCKDMFFGQYVMQSIQGDVAVQ